MLTFHFYMIYRRTYTIPHSFSSWANLQHSNRIGSWIFSSSKCDKDRYQLCITDTCYNHRICLLFYQLWPVIGFRIGYQQGRYTFRIWLCSTWSLRYLYCNFSHTSISIMNQEISMLSTYTKIDEMTIVSQITRQSILPY